TLPAMAVRQAFQPDQLARAHSSWARKVSLERLTYLRCAVVLIESAVDAPQNLAIIPTLFRRVYSFDKYFSTLFLNAFGIPDSGQRLQRNWLVSGLGTCDLSPK